MATDLNLQDYLGGDFIKGRDVDEPMLLTISDVTEQAFKDGTKKPVLHFEETDQVATLGRLNLKRLMEKLTERTSLWVGRQVLLTQGAEYQGNPSLIISPYSKRQPGAAAAGAAAPAAQRAAVNSDDIPF
jgi:hypothetical protein